MQQSMNTVRVLRNNKIFILIAIYVRRFGIWLFGALFWIHANLVTAHPQFDPLIVDTDMALDDARALAIVLAAPELDIKAIITSDGSAPPKLGATNVLRILHFLGRQGIQVGAGPALEKPAPAWAALSTTLGWSDLPLPPRPIVGEARSALAQLFDRMTNKFIWVALGPLSNLGELLKSQPEMTNRISRVFYSGGHPDTPDPGWNTMRAPESARTVFGSGLQIVAVQLSNENTLPFDYELYDEITRLDTPAAKLIARLHAHQKVQQLIHANHFRAWDEIVVLALLEPSVGTWQNSPISPNTRILSQLDLAHARKAYLQELAHEDHGSLGRPPVLLNRFPVELEQFQPDVQPFVAAIIDRHGIEEWVVIVLASELHRHLGLYSILGAKMGLRARELLGAGLDELRVESFAGLKPPVSCLNDGLQVATGASLGRGTIRVIETTNAEPAAVFIYGTRKLHMRIRPEILERVRGTLSALAAEHGESTPANFAALRRFSIEAWRDLDRRKIFEEKIESCANPARN